MLLALPIATDRSGAAGIVFADIAGRSTISSMSALNTGRDKAKCAKDPPRELKRIDDRRCRLFQEMLHRRCAQQRQTWFGVEQRIT